MAGDSQGKKGDGRETEIEGKIDGREEARRARGGETTAERKDRNTEANKGVVGGGSEPGGRKEADSLRAAAGRKTGFRRDTAARRKAAAGRKTERRMEVTVGRQLNEESCSREETVEGRQADEERCWQEEREVM